MECRPGAARVYRGLGLTALPLDAEGRPLAASAEDAVPAGRYLCCIAERDLHNLLPLLPALSGGRRHG